LPDLVFLAVGMRFPFPENLRFFVKNLTQNHWFSVKNLTQNQWFFKFKNQWFFKIKKLVEKLGEEKRGEVE
jgi:hypothetical protein